MDSELKRSESENEAESVEGGVERVEPGNGREFPAEMIVSEATLVPANFTGAVPIGDVDVPRSAMVERS